MSDTPTNGTDHKLGVLIGRLEGVQERLDRADDSRQRSHARMDELADGFTGLQAEVRQLGARMSDTEQAVTAAGQAVDRFERIETTGQVAFSATRAVGRVVKWVGGGGALGVMMFWRELRDWWFT